MPISNVTSYAGPYFPDGTVTDFPFEFDVFATDGVTGLAVARFATDGTMTTLDPVSYTVALSEHGGSANFTVPPDVGDPLFVLADPSFKQEISFGNQTPYLPAVVTEALDRAATRDLYMRGLLARSILVPPGESVGIAPTAAARAGMVLGFDDTGDLLVTVSYTALIAAAASAAEDRRLAQEARDQAQAIIIGADAVEVRTEGFTLTAGDLKKYFVMNNTADALVILPTGLITGFAAKFQRASGGEVALIPDLLAISPATVTSLNGQNKIAGPGGVADVIYTSPITVNIWGALDGVYSPTPAQLLTSSVWDSFSGAAGNLNGRLTEDSAVLPWGVHIYSGANTGNSLQILSGALGALSGNQGTAPNGSFGYVSLPVSNRKWTTRRVMSILAITGANTHRLADHVIVSGANFSVLSPTSTGVSGVAGGMFIYCAVNNVNGTQKAIGTGLWLIDKDNIQVRYDMSGANITAAAYVNGRKKGATVDMGSANPTFTKSNNFGFRGDLAATGAIDFTEFGDPDSDGMISAYAPARVVQREPSGHVILRMAGECCVQAPYSLDYRITDSAQPPADVVPYSAMQSYVRNGLAYTARSVEFASPAGGWVQRHRRGGPGSDILGEAYTHSHGPVQKAGDVFLFGLNSQSLITQFWSNTSGFTDSAPADAWSIMGSTGPDAGVIYPSPDNRNQAQIPANSAMARFVTQYRADSGAGTPICIIQAGKGATTTTQRLPGGDIHNAMLDGIGHAGFNFLYAFMGLGEYELIPDATMAADVAAVTPNTLAIVADVEAFVGKPIVVIICPLGAVWDADDAAAENIRRQLWLLAQQQPTRFVMGPARSDLQHNPFDIYHLVPAGYIESANRFAKTASFLRGDIAHGRNGPFMSGLVTRDSGTQVTVWVDPDGAGGIVLRNGAAHGDYGGGLRFAADTAFATRVYPTACTVGAISGGLYPVAFTFAGSLSPTVYVGGPYGSEPFNQTHDAGIRAVMATNASMLVGTWAGESDIPIRHFYQLTGGDYLHT